MADNGRELFLIDGNSLAYRAFFALPETIATSRGVPTNAIFGFASMLVKVLTEYGVNPTLVCWDAGMSGRETAYEEYKAERRKRPDLLQEQWPHLHPLVEAFGYTNVRVDGYEADDVMATLALQAREKRIPVMMVTGDRDMFQLIEPGVRVMATSRGITETKIYDTQAVVDRYGIPPDLIPDFYGLKGDTSDNIPGVPGIGDKTAAQLLQEFGTLEGVLGNIEKVSGAKRKENLENHAEDARVSKQLATAIRDVPVDIDIEHLVGQEPDRSTLREFFREFELRDPLRRLEEALGGEEAAAPRQRAVEELEATAVEIPAVDLGRVEGKHATLAAERPLDDDGVPHGPLRFAAYAGGDEVMVGDAETLAALTLAWGERPLVAHDWKSLASGEGQCDTPPLEHDTMVAAYLIDPARRKYPLPELLEDEGISAVINGANGLAERAVCTRALAERQLARIEQQGLTKLLHEVEMPLVEVLIDMERAGVKLDTDRLAQINEGFAERIDTLESEIWELAGEEFTIGSPQQLGHILFEQLGLSKKRRGKTGFSTDARVLAAIRDEHPIIAKIEQWRELTKLKSTYLDALPELISDDDGRLHTTFNQTATTTGRLSSTNPNLQNIPIRSEEGREIRACFVAEPGSKLISADYSQIELRVLAHIADEPALQEIFKRGEDIHAATAGEMFGLPPEEVDHGTRSKAKMINFGIVYGLSAYGLADRLNIPQDEAAEFIERYLNRFPKVQEFITRTITSATDDGYVTTLFGRMRRIPELRARQRQTRLLGERLAVNTVIQGTAADIIKVAMVRCWKALRDAGLSTRLVLQIHDELLFEAPESELEAASKIVRDEMVRAFELDPPVGVDVGVGSNWLEAK
ncbi:MAG TPA: DNA polymerase I [Thermoleophilaceae bacterium]